MPTNHCPLCFNPQLVHFHRDNKRDYWRCLQCYLVFVPASQHLSLPAEKAIYDLHQNDVDDPGYRQFLSRLARPLLTALPDGAYGLDFGCGPGPLLANILEQQGHTLKLYDPLYADYPQHLQQRYDFITCTEVAEHFRRPHQEFAQLFALLNPRGLLAVMTKLVINQAAFAHWHYKNDQTHISFFSTETFQWLAEHYACNVAFIGSDVIFLTKQSLD